MTSDRATPVTQPGPTKTCNICFETIHAHAHACRFCGHPQSKLHSWWYRHHLVVGLVPPVMAIGALAFVVLTFAELFDRGADFARHRDQLKIVSSKMSLEDSGPRPLVVVVGMVRNESALPWKYLHIEIQFMDASGELMDVARDVQFGDDPGILPGSERPFSTKSHRDFPPDRYASFKVSIQFARDGRSCW